jgi:hypothetical protein
MSKLRSSWTSVPNTSWGETHKIQFGDSRGFVICKSVNGQQLCIASVQPYFKQDPDEVKRYADLIASAPILRRIVSSLSHLDTDNLDLDELENLITLAKANL